MIYQSYHNKLPQNQSPLQSLEKKSLAGTEWVVPGGESPVVICSRYASSHAPANKNLELV